MVGPATSKSGEDYLYPSERFVAISLSAEVEEAIAAD